ncbi:MAG: branched-chain amino acid aminotransferase [Oligoflexales bacterium]|nr:branched-chain amino acid aminotransferase [Oligoflexales bacterium]
MARYKFLELSGDLKTKINNFKLPEKLDFGQVLTPIMIVSNYKDGEWEPARILPYGPFQIDPSAKALHYGQQIFEGMKAYKPSSHQTPHLFRPLANYERFNRSAERMAMPSIPEDIFMQSVESITHHLSSLIPSKDGESLYLRPFMIATQKGLGLSCSTEYIFSVIACPVGNIFTSNNVKVFIERDCCRAVRGGTGAAKVAGNYGASVYATTMSKKRGFDQTMWLDGLDRKYIEELSGMNVFVVINGELHTPSLNQETILPGITRDSVIQMAARLNIKVHEVKIDIDDVLSKIKSGNCTEMFACGTASLITPIALLGEKDGATYQLRHAYGPITKQLRDILIDIHMRRVEAPAGWIYEV